MSSSPPKQLSVRRTYRRWILLILGGFAIVAVGLWYGPPPNGLRGPVRLVRGTDGRLVSEGDEGSSTGFEVQAGSLNAQNTSTSGSSTSSSDNTRLACRRILLIGKSDHPLMQRVAGLLVEELKGLEYVEEIDYWPVGHTGPAGRLGPDLFLTLDMPELTETGVVSENIDAKVQLAAGHVPIPTSYFLTDGITPPKLAFSWKSDLHHRSNRIGVNSSTARYKLQAENIAKQLSESLLKQLAEWREKYGSLPELPDLLYPEYRQTPKLPLDGYSAKQLVSYSGLWLHNETIWVCKSDKRADVLLPELGKRLEAAGWPTPEISTESPIRLLASKDQTNVEITAVAGDHNKLKGGEFYVRYAERVSYPTRDAMLTGLIDSPGTPLEVLLLFERHYDESSLRRLLAMLHGRPGLSSELWVTVARIQQQLGEDADAKTSLQKAQAMRFIAPSTSDLNDRIKDLAKKLGDESLADELPRDKQPDRNTLDAAGFVAWPPAKSEATEAGAEPTTEAGPAIVRQFGVDQPLAMYHIDVDGKLYRHALIAKTDAAGNYSVQQTSTEPGVASWTGGTPIEKDRGTKLHWTRPAPAVEITVKLLPKDGKLEAMITDRPDPVASQK